MTFSLSTHWNAYRHTSGEKLVEEILGLGFTQIELGYDLNLGLVPGVLEMANTGAVTVTSVHNFCPVPVGAPAGHPELFPLCSRNKHVWDVAQRHTEQSIKFAAQVKARSLVVHAGRVPMSRLTMKLLSLCENGKRYDPKFDRVKDRLVLKRSKKVGPYLERLASTIEHLLPALEKHNICMAIENLPSWEAIPTETELEELLDRFDSPHVGYWHDIGHGQVRQNLGFISHLHCLGKLAPRMRGMHIHDVADTARDHLMPPTGNIDFTRFRRFLRPDVALVLEPAPGTPQADILAGRKVLEEAWTQDEKT